MSLKDAPVENHRAIKVVVIGAGYSGIYCGIRLSQRIRNIDLTVYEKNPTFGGVWYENKYPGCACDVPSHSYQYSFAPNTGWSSWYAPATEVQAYLEDTARRYSVDRYTKFEHHVQSCTWDETIKRWKLEIKVGQTGETFYDESDVLITARGVLNRPVLPDIPGLSEFKGKIMHSARWDETYDFTNKRIGVIGSGSSAIQIVPQLQALPGTNLSCFVRSKTWILPSFGDPSIEKVARAKETFASEKLTKFDTDPSAYRTIRKIIESDLLSMHALTLRGSALSQIICDDFTGIMQNRLATKPDIAKSIIPSFAVGCRRLTPGNGYLEALTAPNVDFITKSISQFTHTGASLTDGSEIPLDALVCATGFDTSAVPPFAVAGVGGKLLQDRFKPFPESYMSVAIDEFPNLFFMSGPNSGIGTGSLTMMIESIGDYIVKCVRKMQKEDLSKMEVKKKRVGNWEQFCQRYFEGTVYKDDCRSWYRKGDRVTGLWPGSTLHCMETLRSPRWEDWEYETRHDEDGEERNPLDWLGNGWSTLQVEQGRDLSYYLEPEFIDAPACPRPEETRRYQLQSFSH